MKYGTALLWMVALLALGLSSPALAVDGVLEINQTCAVNTGCFSGDAAGFPVTITAEGSYRLTSNLVVPDENTDAVVVSVSAVGIDLNNFAITRSACLGVVYPASCVATSGTGSGIKVTEDPAFFITIPEGVSVKNGSVVGMGLYGVYVGAYSEVKDLRVIGNRSHGIRSTTGSMVSGSVVAGNQGYGIFCYSCAYRGNSVNTNMLGTVSSGIDAGGNVCNGSTTCP